LVSNPQGEPHRRAARPAAVCGHYIESSDCVLFAIADSRRPTLTPAQQRGVLMGLLISGGMLIPGNIPNIVAAGRLGISSREWARVGLVTGFPLMALCFGVLYWMA
jgi:predicted cation transporter